MGNKRVCMLGTSPETKGGVGTVVKGYVESVRPEGYSFDHIVTHVDFSAVGKILVAGKAYIKCYASLNSRNYDIVHLHTSFGASFMRSIPFIELAHKRGLPIVNLVHTDKWETFYDEAPQSKKDTIARIYGLCDKVVVLADEWRDIFSTVISPEHIEVLENFTPTYEVNYWPNWDAKTVVFISRIEDYKGCDLIPDICDLVLQRIPDARFLVCGDGSFKDELESRICSYGIDDQVELVGWVDDVKKIQMLKRASLFLLPSYGEGMPMCVLEAMGLGLPVVATNVGGIPRLVADGQNGLLCDSGDAGGIAAAIVSILDSPERLAAMGAVSKERAHLHSFGPYGEKLKSIYDGVLRVH